MNVPSSTDESKTAKLSRERLWELLTPECLRGNSESNSWQQSYHHFLQKEGIDAEMQKKALLLQLWTTQVRAALLSVCLASSHTQQSQTQTRSHNVSKT